MAALTPPSKQTSADTASRQKRRHLDKYQGDATGKYTKVRNICEWDRDGDGNMLIFETQTQLLEHEARCGERRKRGEYAAGGVYKRTGGATGVGPENQPRRSSPSWRLAPQSPVAQAAPPAPRPPALAPAAATTSQRQRVPPTADEPAAEDIEPPRPAKESVIDPGRHHLNAVEVLDSKGKFLRWVATTMEGCRRQALQQYRGRLLDQQASRAEPHGGRG